ncbi:MAG: hypothetical protein V7695_02425, partial [Sulfitobacter sp.]
MIIFVGAHHEDIRIQSSNHCVPDAKTGAIRFTACSIQTSAIYSGTKILAPKGFLDDAAIKVHVHAITLRNPSMSRACCHVATGRSYLVQR